MINDKIYIYPTDTVWGIGANIFSEVGQLDIAKIKGTSTDKPLSVLFADIDSVMNSFNLSNYISKEWLENLFAMETTLAVDYKLAKFKVPLWINRSSSLIAFRCVSNDAIKSIIEKVGAPITTTSLNISGQVPITKIEDARSFYCKYCAHAIMIEDNKTLVSGHSSTFIQMSENKKFTVLRKGALSDRVERYLGI